MSKSYEQIMKLREAKNNNKLIIFVGAGVSANSSLPSWGELIKKFADEIGYTTNNYTMPGETVHFCSDEYLKIPQYVYNKDRKKYKEILINTFGESALSSVVPNKIHEMIFQLSPAHIITTNYDPLLETANVPQRTNYVVVSSDSEMLSKGRTALKYIIKLHGDSKNLCKVVLKEDDYLRYEQTHILLSTFIKSLLVSHTFLFVGYSLNDYNFKQIIDWIEYLAELAKVDKDMTTHYIVKTGDTKISEYEEEYLNSKHISIITSKDLGADWINDCTKDSGLLNPHGNQLYATLKAVIDDTSDMYLLGDFDSMLLKRYSVFDDINFIPYQDFLRVYKWENVVCDALILKSENTDEMDFTYVCLRVFDTDNKSKTFEQLSSITKNAEICKYFLKASIWSAENRSNHKRETVNFLNINEQSIDNTQMELFDLYIYNDYITLFERIKSITDERLKAYWLYCANLDRKLTENDQLAENSVILFEKMSNQVHTGNSSVFWNIVDKTNLILAIKTLVFDDSTNIKLRLAYEQLREIHSTLTETQKSAISYLYEIVIDRKNDTLTLECMQLLEKHQADYDNPIINKTDPWDKLKQISQRVFCFYKFIKSNYVILDRFKETTDLFWTFTRAVLYTYKERESNKGDISFGTTDFPKCPIDSLMLDIIVKYHNHKDLIGFISTNRLKGFIFSSQNDIATKFDNICKTFMWLRNDKIHNILNNFCVLLRYGSICAEVKVNLVNSIKELLESDETYLEYKNYFIRCLSEQPFNELRNAIASILITFATNDSIYVLSMFLSSLKTTGYYVQFACYVYHNISNKKLKNEITTHCTSQSASFSECELFNLCISNIIQIDVVIKNRLLQWALSNLTNNGEYEYTSGVIVHGSNETKNANLIMLWLFLYKHITVDDLQQVFEESEYLKYIMDFDNFDVANIDTSDFLWIMILEDSEQHQKLLSNIDKRTVVGQKLRDKIDRGVANDDEKRIYWKYFE